MQQCRRRQPRRPPATWAQAPYRENSAGAAPGRPARSPSRWAPPLLPSYGPGPRRNRAPAGRPVRDGPQTGRPHRRLDRPEVRGPAWPPAPRARPAARRRRAPARPARRTPASTAWCSAVMPGSGRSEMITSYAPTAGRGDRSQVEGVRRCTTRSPRIAVRVVVECGQRRVAYGPGARRRGRARRRSPTGRPGSAGPRAAASPSPPPRISTRRVRSAPSPGATSASW